MGGGGGSWIVHGCRDKELRQRSGGVCCWWEGVGAWREDGRLQRCTLWPFGRKRDGGGEESGFSSFSAAFRVQLAATSMCATVDRTVRTGLQRLIGEISPIISGSGKQQRKFRPLPVIELGLALGADMWGYRNMAQQRKPHTPPFPSSSVRN